MAKIVTNELAPKDVQSFSLANENFEAPFETNDPVVISNAAAHPWLDVEYDKETAVAPQFVDRQVSPADDAHSAQNSVANDPKAVKAALEARDDLTAMPLAVDAGLKQDKAETVGEGDDKVAVTIAADETDSTKTRKSTRGQKEE